MEEKGKERKGKNRDRETRTAEADEKKWEDDRRESRENY